ncbi:hypothetical protein SAMN05444422_104211 [Halobiforma haloterrestris]|uniref:DUF7575 domain-containing protein n=1 Tax=Natronobacterium haloterrestre TaxID=148448 RepID=A0A1I1GGP7_NATHA|nr:zinc ribbon domain-containing protein [Halobiforma haloterrestris]SFC09038.1 hypothetical protein SAMN05444422_104211 [Halobiforma haloterrestris]
MDGRSSAKRPWLAAILTLLATGLGQVYVRRWLRAVGWVALSLLVGVAFVPESALVNPGTAGLRDIAPVAAVGLASAIDAYALATRHNLRLEAERAVRCSNCYRELEADLAFCPWCGIEATTGDDPD